MRSSSSPISTHHFGYDDSDQRRTAPAPAIEPCPSANQHDDGVALATVRHASTKSPLASIHDGEKSGVQAPFWIHWGGAVASGQVTSTCPIWLPILSGAMSTARCHTRTAAGVSLSVGNRPIAVEKEKQT